MAGPDLDFLFASNGSLPPRTEQMPTPPRTERSVSHVTSDTVVVRLAGRKYPPLRSSERLQPPVSVHP